MFGDSALLGQKELTVDDKGRIFIPAETKREAGDMLVLFYDKDLDLYKIYSFSKIEEMFKDLSKKILESKTKTEEIENKIKIYELGKSILKCEKVSEEGRIKTGDVFEAQQKVLSIGCMDHLIIEPIKNK